MGESTIGGQSRHTARIMARRPQQVVTRPPPSAADIAQAQYVGGKEHKSVRWWGGLPGAYVGGSAAATRPKKQKTTICPLVAVADRDCATTWVKEAIRSGQYRFREGDKSFPKHVWYRDADGRIWFGFCTNGVLKEYQGWPIDEEERREIFG